MNRCACICAPIMSAWNALSSLGLLFKPCRDEFGEIARLVTDRKNLAEHVHVCILFAVFAPCPGGCLHRRRHARRNFRDARGRPASFLEARDNDRRRRGLRLFRRDPEPRTAYWARSFRSIAVEQISCGDDFRSQISRRFLRRRPLLKARLRRFSVPKPSGSMRSRLQSSAIDAFLLSFIAATKAA